MTQPTTNQKGSPPKYEIKPPAKIPRHHLSPSDGKAQDILHEHQSKLLEKIHAGVATPEDHLRFSQVRERLNQITSAALAKVKAVEEQQSAKFRKQVKNEETGTDVVHRVTHLEEPLTVLENPSHGAIRNWLKNLKNEGDAKAMLVGIVHPNGRIFVSEGQVPTTGETILHAALHRTMGGSGSLPATHRFLLGLDKNEEPHISAYADPYHQPEHLKNWANSQGLVINEEIDPTANALDDLPAESPYKVEKYETYPYAVHSLNKYGVTKGWHLLHLLGAPTHIPITHHKVYFNGETAGGDFHYHLIGVEAKSPEYTFRQTIDPINHIVHSNHNRWFRTGTGQGTDMFYHRANRLSKAGFKEMHNLAAEGPTFNGGYTWFATGYNAPFEPHEQAMLPPEYQHATSVQHLFSMPGGRNWWKHNNWSKYAIFDLRPGSDSMKILHAYKHVLSGSKPMTHHNEPVRRTDNFHYGEEQGDFLDLAPWEEEALERMWQEREKHHSPERDVYGVPSPSEPIGEPTVPPISPFDTERNLQLPSVKPDYFIPPVTAPEVRPLLEIENPPPAENAADSPVLFPPHDVVRQPDDEGYTSRYPELHSRYESAVANPAHREAAELYQYEASEEMNHYLKHSTTIGKYTREQMARLTNHISDLHKAISNARPFPEHQLVYRGISLPHDQLEETIRHLRETGKYVHHGFVSTSYSPREAATMAYWSGKDYKAEPLMMEIKTKRGLPLTSGGIYDYQQELLLPHKSVFKVHGFAPIKYQMPKVQPFHSTHMTFPTLQMEHIS